MKNEPEKRWFVYLLFCNDGSLYTGYTNDVDKRVERHNAGKGSKYTRSRLPVILVYAEEYDTKSDAMKREYVIKQMARKDKKELTHGSGSTRL